MMHEHLSDELLQRHYDGDLSSSEDAEARAHLERCAECRAQLAAFTRLTGLLQLAAADAAREADFQGMFARIERGAAAAVGDGERAVPIPAARGAMTAPAIVGAPAKIRRIRPMAPALGALAIAAAAMLTVFRQDGPTDDVPADPEGEQLASLSHGRSEIVEIDFGDNAGTVFDIALADGSSVPVVWINDEDE
jgi:anti-sigma factor RsiW